MSDNLGPIARMFLPQPLELRIPLEPGVDATVILPRPMTEARWQQFWHVLDTMKPGIVRADPEGDHDDR